MASQYRPCLLANVVLPVFHATLGESCGHTGVQQFTD